LVGWLIVHIPLKNATRCVALSSLLAIFLAYNSDGILKTRDRKENSEKSMNDIKQRLIVEEAE
jgi:hypothetical protein